MLEIQENSRQVPKEKAICANKKYYDILYSYLQCISVRKEDNKRYFSHKDINFTSLGKTFNLSRQTVSTKFKNLIDLGLVIPLNNGEYELTMLEGAAATLIAYPVLKLMVDTLSENCISAYVYLFNRYWANGCEEFVFTLDQVKTYIGISTSTRSNNDIITNILYVLDKIGLIKYEMTGVSQDDTSFQNVKTIYKIKWVKNSLNK